MYSNPRACLVMIHVHRLSSGTGLTCTVPENFKVNSLSVALKLHLKSLVFPHSQSRRSKYLKASLEINPTVMTDPHHDVFKIQTFWVLYQLCIRASRQLPGCRQYPFKFPYSRVGQTKMSVRKTHGMTIFRCK